MRLLLLIVVFLFGAVLSAQETPVDEPGTTPEAQMQDDGPVVYRATLQVESAFIRVLPSEEAEPVASVFEEDVLEVVGRNLDGTWFEVRRPYRMTNLGWIFEEMLDWDFAPEFLPLGDAFTGATGDTLLDPPTNAAVFVVEGVALRIAPRLRAERILNIPPNVTIPVLSRNLDASWLYVHYLGTEGWIIGFTTRRRADILDIVPLAPDAPLPETPPIVVIPPEIQLAQVERLRTYMTERRLFARNLAGFWAAVNKGEVMPCEALPPVPDYAVTDQDVRELPELDRYLPRLDEAVSFLNRSQSPLEDCGVITPTQAGRSRNDAINAGVIFDATLERLADLEENVIR